MIVWTFGLSPPDASACCSDAAFAAYSAASCRSEVMLWTKRYPEDPAPRGLAGQELGTLERQNKPKINTVVISFITKARSSYSRRYSKALWSWRSRCNGLTFALWLIQSPDRLRKKSTRDKIGISTKSWHSLPYVLPAITTEQRFKVLNNSFVFREALQTSNNIQCMRDEYLSKWIVCYYDLLRNNTPIPS